MLCVKGEVFSYEVIKVICLVGVSGIVVKFVLVSLVWSVVFVL